MSRAFSRTRLPPENPREDSQKRPADTRCCIAIGNSTKAVATMPTDQRSGQIITPPPIYFPERNNRSTVTSIPWLIRLSASIVTRISPEAA